MAAHGSGAAARSIRDKATVMNVDVGGGTSKIAVCVEGRVVDLTALDVGARLVCLDAEGRIVRIEEAGAPLCRRTRPHARRSALDAGARSRARAGGRAWRTACSRRCAAARPAPAARGLLRLDPLPAPFADRPVTFSGGVAEYIYGREAQPFGDLGAAAGAGDPRAGRALGPGARARQRRHPRHRDRRLAIHHAGERLDHLSSRRSETLPLRNVPVIAPALALDAEAIDPAAVAAAIADAAPAPRPRRPATRRSRCSCPGAARRRSQRLDAFCRGVVGGPAPVLARGHPLVLAGDGDVGGLIGIHLREEIAARQRHRLDRRARTQGVRLSSTSAPCCRRSGAVPVVIKSLIFPRVPRPSECQAK